VIEYRVRPDLANEVLTELYAASWPRHSTYDFTRELELSLTYVCAYQGDRLVGFVRLAWDGGIHAFLLEPTVHPDLRRRGIGRRLVAEAVDVARQRGMHWVHVDFDPDLRPFYDACGFRSTEAGLIRLNA
jgi:GNAT superfamily N-acetyltransferase